MARKRVTEHLQLKLVGHLAMASQIPQDQESKIQWQKGDKCEIYCGYKRKWIEGEVINIFDHDQTKWISVRYDNRMRKRDIHIDDPLLRERNVAGGMTLAMTVSRNEMNLLKELVMERRELAPLLERLIDHSPLSIAEDSSKSYFCIVSEAYFSSFYVHIIRILSLAESMTWYKLEHCIKNELFPAIQLVIAKCVEEKLRQEPEFEADDLGEDAVEDIIEKLKNTRKSTNNKEIKYLRQLIERANTVKYENEHDPQSLVIASRGVTMVIQNLRLWHSECVDAMLLCSICLLLN